MNFTLRNNTTFPDGTTVGVYNAYAFPFEGAGGPQADELATATMTDGAATFAGLDPDTQYVAAALVAGSWRKVGFRTEPIGPSQGSFDADDDITFGGAIGFTGSVTANPDIFVPPLARKSVVQDHQAATADVHGIVDAMALLYDSDIGTGAGKIAAADDSRFLSSAIRSALAAAAGTPGGSNPFILDDDDRLVTAAIAAALAAAAGTPSGGNAFVLDDDPRWTAAPVRTSVNDIYDFQVGDEGVSLYSKNNNNPKTWALHHSSVWNAPIGTVIRGRNMGTQPLTIVAATDPGGTPIIRSDGGVLVIGPQFRGFSLEKFLVDSWFLEGNIG